MTHPMHEISDYAARHGIPTIHESDAVTGADGVEVDRLRFDLSGIRHNLDRLSGPHPDGTSMGDPKSFEARWAAQWGCGHPNDPGYSMDRMSFLARHYGLAHPEVAAVLAMVAGWELRLPQDFDAVRSEYLEWHAASEGRKMFRDWQALIVG